MREPSMPPVEFLLDSSLTSLQDLELASLNRADSLGKQIRVSLEQWVEQRSAANVARWMIDNRAALLQGSIPAQKVTFEEILVRRKEAS